MVDQDEAGHGFTTMGTEPLGTTHGVIPTGSGKLNGLTGHRGLLFFADGSDRFETARNSMASHC